jgi:hypothetical protein
MPSEESPAAKFDRLKKQLQDAILRDYPNPERRGCPGDAVLRELGARPMDRPVEDDPHWHHITHCSECYGEFLAFNNEVRQRAKVRKVRLGWALAGVAAALSVGVLVGLYQGGVFPKRPQNAELAYVKKTVDIPSMTRSPDGAEPKPIMLERQPEELTIQLPLGSKAGAYELQLKRNDETVVSAASNAEIHNGTTAFTVKLDLSNLRPGNYSIVVRQVPFDWNYYPVVIR